MVLRRVVIVLFSQVVCVGTARTDEPKAPKPHVLIPTLVALPSDQPPVLDGKDDDPIWAAVQPVVVMAATATEAVPVEVRACTSEGSYVLRLSWSDKAADTSKSKSDSLSVTWTLESAQVTQAFDAASPLGGGSVRGAWTDDFWTVEVVCAFQPPAPGATGDVGRAQAFTLSVRDPTRGLAASGPVQVRPGRAATRRDFHGDAPGAAAAGIRSALAGKGKPPSWVVRADEARTSNVLVQEAQDMENDRYPLALLEGFEAKDVDLSVRFQARKGFKDQAAGIVWRVRDAGNHYLLRANVLEQNVVCYKMENNLRVDLPPLGRESDYGVEVKFDPRGWHTLRAVVTGNRFQAYLDGRLLFEVLDRTFQDRGGVGLWTKSDTVMAFDDALAVSLDATGAK